MGALKGLSVILNSLDDPRMYLKKEFFIAVKYAFLDTWQIQPVHWIVVEKILPLVCTVEIVSYPYVKEPG